MNRFSSLHILRWHCSLRWTLVAAWIALSMLALPMSAQKAQAQTPAPWQHLTQSQLTAVWWQWAFRIPAATNPLLDDTGVNAYQQQPYADLLFLCGTFTISQQQNGDLLGSVRRSVSIKQGTALFFPLLNGEADNVCGAPRLGGNCFSAPKFPNVLGVPELRALASALQDQAYGLYARLTPSGGTTVPLSYSRLQSPPFAFTLPLPATDNIYGVSVRGKVAPAVADGYFSFIPGTLAPGYYMLEFGGTIPINDAGNVFMQQIIYDINVIP